MAKYLVPFTELREVSLPIDVVQLVDRFIDDHTTRIAHGPNLNGVIKEGFNIPTREEFIALAHQIIEVTQHEQRRRQREGPRERDGRDNSTRPGQSHGPDSERLRGCGAPTCGRGGGDNSDVRESGRGSGAS